MAADIEHIFQDFILNKIREIEDQSGDAGHSNEGGSNGDNVSEKVHKDQEDAVGSRKKHKKHKKHKSKKKKKKKEEKESSSESGVESEGGTTQHLTTGGQEEQPNKENDSQRGEDDKGHSKRHKKHSGKKKKKKKKRKKDADKSSSGSESESETKLRDAKGASSEDRERRVGGPSRRTEDLPDIIPKQDSTKKVGDTERDGRWMRRSRSRSGSRSDRRSHRSRNRSRRSVTRSRSRSRRRRSRSRSRSERRLRRTRSRSPRKRSRTRSRSRGRRSTSLEKGSERNQATENPLPPSLPCPAPPPLVQVSPSDPAPKEQTVAAPPASSACASDPVLDVARSVGGWKPVPFLGVSSGKKEEPAVGSSQPLECPRSPQKCPTPAEVPMTESETEAAPDSQRESCEPQNLPEPSEKPPEGPAENPSGRRAKSPARSASLETREMAEERQHETADKTASPSKKKMDKSSGSLKKRSEGKSSSKKKKRSKSPSHKKKSKSRSPSRRKRSRSRSPARRVRRSRSRSGSRRRRGPYGGALSQRDRWKREPSHSPVLILRKNRSPARKHHCDSTSPSRITELDKEQLLEIAKANAAAMCAKAGVPIPESLRASALSAMCLPMNLPALAMNAAMASMTAATMTAALSSMGALASMPPLPSITNKPPPGVPQANMAAIEEVKRKVAKQVNSISIKEFTDKCKKIVEKGGELAVAKPHVSDDEDDGKPFGSSALKEHKAISFSLNNMSVRPAARSDAAYAKEFPVSSGSQHRKKEGEGAYGEWVAVDKKEEKAKALAAAAAKTAALVPKATETPALPPAPPVAKQDSVVVPPSDSVFPDPPQEPVDIGQAVIERIKAQRRLAENPYDLNAICMLSHAQEQVDAWAQSNTIPGLFTGSTGAQVLTSEELSTGGPQAWLKKVERQFALRPLGGDTLARPLTQVPVEKGGLE